MKMKPDYNMTPAAIERMKRELDRLIREDRPKAVKEAQRTAEMGDFSENAAYSEAKYQLRKINSRITTLEERIKDAIPIEAGPDASGRVRLGSTVVIETGGRNTTYEIVGAQETDPSRGRISHASPLGQILIGRSEGESAVLKAGTKETVFRIVEVK